MREMGRYKGVRHFLSHPWNLYRPDGHGLQLLSQQIRLLRLADHVLE